MQLSPLLRTTWSMLGLAQPSDERRRAFTASLTAHDLELYAQAANAIATRMRLGPGNAAEQLVRQAHGLCLAMDEPATTNALPYPELPSSGSNRGSALLSRPTQKSHVPPARRPVAPAFDDALALQAQPKLQFWRKRSSLLLEWAQASSRPKLMLTGVDANPDGSHQFSRAITIGLSPRECLQVLLVTMGQQPKTEFNYRGMDRNHSLVVQAIADPAKPLHVAITGPNRVYACTLDQADAVSMNLLVAQAAHHTFLQRIPDLSDFIASVAALRVASRGLSGAAPI